MYHKLDIRDQGIEAWAHQFWSPLLWTAEASISCSLIVHSATAPFAKAVCMYRWRERYGILKIGMSEETSVQTCRSCSCHLANFAHVQTNKFRNFRVNNNLAKVLSFDLYFNVARRPCHMHKQNKRHLYLISF